MKDRRLWALVAAGTLLRFLLLTRQSFWYDEAVSADLASHDLVQVAIGHIRDLGNPPLHSVLLGVWARVFGAGDASLRAMSALIGALAIPLMFAIARRLAGDRAALIATALLTFSPLHVYMSQEARTYALLTLLTMLSTYALLRGVEAPTEARSGQDAALEGRKGGQKRWWALYAVATFGAAYSHYFALMLAIGQAVYIVIAYRRDRRVLVGFACGAIGAGLLFSFWVPALIAQMSTKGNLGRSADTWYLHFAAAPLVFGAGTTLVWKGLGGVVRMALGGLTLLVLLTSAILGLRAVKQRGFVLAWLLSPLVLPLVISVALFPFFTVRYGMIALPPYLLLVGAGLAAIPPKRAIALGSILGLGIAVSLGTYFSTMVKNDFRGAVALVEPQLQPGDVILFDADFHELAWARYATSSVPRLRLLHAKTPGHVEGVAHAGDPQIDLASAITSHKRVWLIEADYDKDVEKDLHTLLQTRIEAVSAHVRGLEIHRFDPNPRSIQ